MQIIFIVDKKFHQNFIEYYDKKRTNFKICQRNLHKFQHLKMIHFEISFSGTSKDIFESEIFRIDKATSKLYFSISKCKAEVLVMSKKLKELTFSFCMGFCFYGVLS